MRLPFSPFASVSRLEQLRLVMADMGLDTEHVESEKQAVHALFNQLRAAGATNCDPTDGSLRVPSFEFLRLMQAQVLTLLELEEPTRVHTRPHALTTLPLSCE